MEEKGMLRLVLFGGVVSRLVGLIGKLVWSGWNNECFDLCLRNALICAGSWGCKSPANSVVLWRGFDIGVIDNYFVYSLELFY